MLWLPERTPFVARVGERERLEAAWERGRVQQASGSTETERWQLFEAAASLLAAIGEDQPVMLVLDDMYWADRSSALLTHLVRRAGQSRLALAGTYRDSELGPTHPLAEALADLRRDHQVQRIALAGLDPAATARLFETLAGPAAVKALGRALHERREGNPFFVEELWRHLVDTGALSGGTVATVAAGELGTPEGVQDLVAGRLRLLSENANLALAHAAVVDAPPGGRGHRVADGNGHRAS